MKFKLSSITVEPAIFLFAFSCGLSGNGEINLIIVKVCSENATGFNHSCIEKSTELNTIKSMLKECLPIISLLLGGAWRDKHGRNIPLLILTISGQILGALVCLLSAIFWEIPITVTLLAEGIITGLIGSLPLLLMVATCFIATRTSVQDRTYRMSFMLAAYLGGTTIGLVMGGLVLENFGFTALFGIAVFLAVVSLLYVLLFISEIPAVSKEPLPLWMIFNVLVKKRKKYIKPTIFLMIIVECLFGSVLLSESNVFIFFLENSLKLSVADAGFYSSYKAIMLGLSSFIVVPVLSKYFKIEDISLGIISSLVMILGAIWSAFSMTRLLLALCPLTDLLKGAVFAVEKSIMTKCLNPNELGQLLGAVYIIIACCNLIFLPFYTYVYNKTSSVFPGGFFMLSAAFSLIILLAFCITKYLFTNKSEDSDLKNLEDESITKL